MARRIANIVPITKRNGFPVPIHCTNVTRTNAVTTLRPNRFARTQRPKEYTLQPEPTLHLHVGEVRPAHGVSPPEKSKPFHRRSSADGRHSSHLINIVRERPPNRPG